MTGKTRPRKKTADPVTSPVTPHAENWGMVTLAAALSRALILTAPTQETQRNGRDAVGHPRVRHTGRCLVFGSPGRGVARSAPGHRFGSVDTPGSPTRPCP